MNSYNDNLHSAVTSSLASQELDIKSVQSQAIASVFTLFHAEAATITAQEKLEADQDILAKKTLVNDQAVINSNISTNLLASATQADSYVKQSVTNTSVGAANMQVAANAIVRLAGDMGSIYSIVHAADYQSDIYNLTEQARTLINDTAYLAEVASDLSMEASILTSEVASGSTLTKAKASNTSLQNLFATTTSDFNNASQQVAADTVNVGTVSTTEQAAEGTFEDIAMDYRSTWAAYRSTQKELNLNLRTSAIQPTKENVELFGAGSADSMRKIKFNLIRSAFPKYKVKATQPAAVAKNAVVPVQPQDDDWSFYPVEQYYLMLVKDSKKSTFTIANAETIIRDYQERAIEVPEALIEQSEALLMELHNPAKRPTSIKAAKSKASNQTVSGAGYRYTVHPRSMEVDIDFLKVNDGKFKDTDGEEVAFGTDYVIFVMAKYQEAYKKEINNFEDFISAPSWKFTLRHQLTAVDGTAVQFGSSDDVNNPNRITFSVSPVVNAPVEYRCMFLPYGPDLPKGLLNKLSMEALMYEINLVERIADTFDPQIAKLELELALLNAQSAGMPAGELGATATEITKTQEQLTVLIKDRDDQMAVAVAAHRSNVPQGTDANVIDYIFNQTIAEQITAGNYLSVEAPAITAPGTQSYHVDFGVEMTDIFGSLLAPSDKLKYLMVVLSVYNGEEDNVPAYANTWSGYETAPAYPQEVTETKTTKKK